MGYFTGKTIWITGASSGIGAALARALSQQDTKLILSSRRADKLEEVKQSCATPHQIKVLPLDLEENDEAKEWVTRAWALFNGVDILVNNGGIGQFGRSLETEEAVERKLFEVNYFGNVALTRHLLPRMLEQGSGQIMVIASIAGKFGQAKLAAYSASKGALILYYESLKEELHDDPVKIQVVSPGFIQTDVTLNSLKPDGSKMNTNSPAQENGMPADTFAQKLLKVMQGSRFHSYIGRKELLAVPLHALLPGFFYKMIRKN